MLNFIDLREVCGGSFSQNLRNFNLLSIFWLGFFLSGEGQVLAA